MSSLLAVPFIFCFLTISNCLWFNAKEDTNTPSAVLLEFDQLIDHNNTSLGTFKQRYYIDATYYTPNGKSPLYLSIGGEGSITASFGQTRANWAQQNNALQAVLEHRYYGTSFPYPGSGGYSLKSLQYLSVEQALADLKYFVESDIFKNYTLSASKILFGCSYAGGLSAWSKIKYPETWTAIVSGSGVVDPAWEYPTYIQWGNMDMLKYSYSCYDNLRNAGSYIADELLTSTEGRAYLAGMFNVCDIPSPAENSYSVAVQQLFYFLMGSLPVQSDNPSNRFPMQQLCASLSTSDMNVNETLAIWSKWAAYSLGVGDDHMIAEEYDIAACYNLSAYIGMYLITNLKAEDVGARNTWKSWAYQVCTEMGWFQTIRAGESALGENGSVSLAYLSTACSANGMGIDNYNGPDVDKMHKEFHGNQVSSFIENAFFDYGHYDPWRWVTTAWLQPNNKNVFLYEHDAAHCAAFATASVDDSASIKDERILIGNWLSQFN